MLFFSKKPNLFVVDDNSVARVVLEALVNNHFNYKVDKFPSAEDCLQKASKKPSIILLDYGLPGMNGLDAIPMLKAKWPETQIVMVSSQKDLNIVRKVLAADIVDYVEKSLNLLDDLSNGILSAEKKLKTQRIH